MTPDQELVLLFGGLHLVALMFGCVLFYMFMKSDTADSWDSNDEDEEGGGGGGGNDRISDSPKRPGPGGVPLPDAVQSSERFRGPGRLADRHPWPQRRAPEPQRTPRRVPERSR